MNVAGTAANARATPAIRNLIRRGTRPNQFCLRATWMRLSRKYGAAYSPKLLPNDEFESRPNLADRANLDVNEAQWQRHLTNSDGGPRNALFWTEPRLAAVPEAAGKSLAPPAISTRLDSLTLSFFASGVPD